MIGFIIRKVIGSKNDREVKRLRMQLVPKINEIEQGYQSLTDEQLRAGISKDLAPNFPFGGPPPR